MDAPATPNNEAPPAASFAIKAQYIKDLSFENPNAPHSLAALEKRPTIDVKVDLRGQKLQENFNEITIFIAAKASTEQGILFLVELAYAGIFELVNIPETRMDQVLWVDCPFVLFPFARRVIADVTRDGGFPPLMLDPIDFQTLYLQHRAGKPQSDG